MPTKRRIGIAVSGGADSTALLALLASCRRELNFDAEVLHVDHAIRPDSASDARFVRSLSRQFGIPFHSTRLSIVRRKGESIEMAARRERLAFFARMTRRLKLDAIATGHHADDVAETFLLRLARGSGPVGLAGLKRISRISVPAGPRGELLPIVFIRPLLDIRDSQLREYLTLHGIPWREDSTNADTSIPRNKVRRIVLPWLKANFDPRITEHLCKSAAILRGDLTLPAESTQFPIPNSQFPIPHSPFPIPHSQFSILNSQFPIPAPPPPPANYKLVIRPSTGFTRTPAAIGVLPASCRLSRRFLAGRSLELRPWREGDRISPTGMDGRARKLQDVFVTAKVPPSVRRSLPVLALAGTSTVLWIPGYRVAEAAAVESPDAPSWEFALSSR